MNSRSVQLLLSFRQLLIALLHAALIALAWYGSFALRFDFAIEGSYRQGMLDTLPIVLGTKLLIFYAFGLFHGWWKYAGVSELIDIAMAAAASAVVAFGLTAWLNGLQGFPRSVFLLDFLLTLTLVGGVRFVVRVYSETFRAADVSVALKRVLVVGAGRTGAALVREMRTNSTLHYQPVGFVDDDPKKRGISLNGVAVRGTTADLPSLVTQLKVDEVLLATPTADGAAIRRIVEACSECEVAFKIIPAVGDLIDGRLSVSRIREVRIDDLLGRDEIKTDMTLVRANTEGHCVLVTGAAGSIGSELSRQLALMAPSQLVLVERSESDLHDLELALREALPNVELTAIVGDILDFDDLESTFRQFRPSRVYHAAAYKHVALMERHVALAIRNNVIGTFNVATLAARYGAQQCVLISTDKAVRPTSLMGATKRAAERVLLSMGDGKTRFTAVRFGNVLGSRGSVVPIFTRQIAAGGPVTVTHPDVVRFFMTIPEAVQLVLQASAMSHGGDVFHLDMGEPVRIADLAANMVRLSGFEPGRDIEIKFVGLRSGEKLYEELLIDGEEVAPTAHPRVRLVRTIDPGVPASWIDSVRHAAETRHVPRLVDLIREAVPEYTPSDLVLRPIAPASVPQAWPAPSREAVATTEEETYDESRERER